MQDKLARKKCILPRFHELRRAWRTLSILGALLTSASNLARNSPNAEQGCSYTERLPCDVDLLSMVGPWSSVPVQSSEGCGGDVTTLRCVVSVGTVRGTACARPVELTHAISQDLVHGGKFCRRQQITTPRAPATGHRASGVPDPASYLISRPTGHTFFYYPPERNPAN